MRSTDTLTGAELPRWTRAALAGLLAVAIGLTVGFFGERALPLMAVEVAVILGFVVQPTLLLDATAALVPLGVFVAYLTPLMPGQAQATDALLFSFAVSSFAHPSVHGRRRRVPAAPIVLGLAFVGIALLSLTQSEYKAEGVRKIGRIVVMGLALLGASRSVTPQIAQRAARILTATTVLAAALAIAITVARASQVGLGSDGLRLWAGLVDPNHYAVLLAMVFALVLVGKRDRTALRWLAAVLVLLAAELLTLSRGGLLALGAGVATVIALLLVIPRSFARLGLGHRATAVIAVCVLGAVALGLAAPSFTDTAVGRYVKIGDPSTDPSATLRLRIWDTAAKLLDEAPYLGIGPGAFVSATGESGGFVHGFEAHNSILETAVETGFPAAACLVALLTWAGVAGAARVRRLGRVADVDADRLGLAAGALAAYAAGIVGALTLSNFLYEGPFILICILLIGALAPPRAARDDRQ